MSRILNASRQTWGDFPWYWLVLATGFNTPPTQIGTTTTPSNGTVYQYDYDTATTYYRFIADDGSDDAFYDNWDGTTLSGFLTNKKVEI